jgi:hypothetical protein
MRSTEPPKVARWLLGHFGSSPNNDTVIGDLDERYHQGHSYIWYWRQALSAIVMSFYTEVRGHKLMAIGTVLFGWMIKAAWGKTWGLFTFVIMGLRPIYSQRYIPFLLASVAESIAVCLISAWLLSRATGSHYRPMVLLYVLVELLAVPVMITLGQHRPFPDPSVLLGAPGEISGLWAAPFTAYVATGLSRLGYPFETVIALWLGSILMAVTMLLSGGILRSRELQQSRQAGI